MYTPAHLELVLRFASNNKHLLLVNMRGRGRTSMLCTRTWTRRWTWTWRRMWTRTWTRFASNNKHLLLVKMRGRDVLACCVLADAVRYQASFGVSNNCLLLFVLYNILHKHNVILFLFGRQSLYQLVRQFNCCLLSALISLFAQNCNLPFSRLQSSSSAICNLMWLPDTV